jgi:hypothetical protein
MRDEPSRRQRRLLLHGGRDLLHRGRLRGRAVGHVLTAGGHLRAAPAICSAATSTSCSASATLPMAVFTAPHQPSWSPA